MGTLTPSFRRPNTVPAGAAHQTVISAIQSHDNSITDINQAIAAQANQIAALKSPSSSTSSGSSTTTQVSTENVTTTNIISGGVVNNQSGNTTYVTGQRDNGALLIFTDTSPVSVTLNNGVTLPWYCFIYNGGPSDITVTGQQGNINSQPSEIITPGLFSIVFFDGGDYWAAALPIVPATFVPVLHEFLTGYDAVTGIFSAAQPSFTDISGTATTNQIGTGIPSAGEYVDGGTGVWTSLPPPPTVPATISPVAGEYLTGYDVVTGIFSKSTPAGLTVTVTTAALTSGGTQGSQTFVGGILTGQVQAT